MGKETEIRGKKLKYGKRNGITWKETEKRGKTEIPGKKLKYGERN